MRCYNARGAQRLAVAAAPRRSWRFAVRGTAAAAVMLVAAYQAAAEHDESASTADPELVELGDQIYAQNCAGCHGVELEGEPDWKRSLPDGGMPAPPHDATGHTWHHGDRLLFEMTKFGGQAMAPAGFKSNMPAFGEQLSDREIWAVLAFIKSRWPAEIQALQQQRSASQS